MTPENCTYSHPIFLSKIGLIIEAELPSISNFDIFALAQVFLFSLELFNQNS